jgi:mannose-6-phosphate isomerase-like protein (cupin superfamily)
MSARTSPLRPTVVAPEQATVIRPFGVYMKVLLATEDTGGAVSVIMAWHKPGEGPPDHVHFSQDEMFFIVGGIYELTIDGQTSTIGSGSVVFVPRGCVHRFKNVGDRIACMLDWSLPGGQDRYFRAIAELAAGNGFTGERVIEISKTFDTNFPASQGAAAHALQPSSQLNQAE